MAEKKKASTRQTKKTSDDSPKVTRITASDSKPKSARQTKTSSKTETKKPAAVKTVAASGEEKKNPIKAIGGYFKGSWVELRQVRWPNRRTTWSLTLAVLVFTAFFVVVIMLLDYLFQMLFERILG